MLKFMENIAELGKKKLLIEKTYTEGKFKGLRVLKYSAKAFYDSAWKQYPELMEMRGLVLDEQDNIVAYPFTKVFNLLQENTKVNRDSVVQSVRKVNGYMACLSVYNGKLIVSTTGTLDSEYAVWAEKQILADIGCVNIAMLVNYLTELNVSLMFEICVKQDPHIVSEDYGAYLIGGRKKTIYSKLYTEAELDALADSLGWLRPEFKEQRFSEVLQESNQSTEIEGFMVRGLGGEVLCKLKSPYYKTMKYLMRDKKNIKQMFTNVGEFIKGIDARFTKVVQVISKTHNYESWIRINEQAKRKYIETLLVLPSNTYGNLFLLRGLPGSGKSTLARYLAWYHYEADQYFVDDNGNYNWDASKLSDAHMWCLQMALNNMCSSNDVVVSNTFTTEKEMQAYNVLAELLGYRVHSLIVENRHNGITLHNVPNDTMQNMQSRFEVKLSANS